MELPLKTSNGFSGKSDADSLLQSCHRVPASIVVVEREPHFEIDLVMRHLAIFDMTARL
jgi:hypothetical protein